MWLNSTAQNALRAVLHIAEHAGGGVVRVGDIAATLGCPRNYLSKTLHALARAGVLRSTRGRHGGFQLAEPPERVPLARVVGPFEPANDRRCLLGRTSCGGTHPCAAHRQWSDVASAVETFFGQTTVAGLLKQRARSRRTRAGSHSIT